MNRNQSTEVREGHREGHGRQSVGWGWGVTIPLKF